MKALPPFPQNRASKREQDARAYTLAVIKLDEYLRRWDGLCLDSPEDRATLAHALVRDGLVPR